MKYRIIVAGGRDFADQELLNREMTKICNKLDGEITIVSGHAKGADKMGENFAKEHGYELVVFKANWKHYGSAAGPIRNSEMVEFAKEETPVLVAFWNGESRGTKDTIDKASRAGFQVVVVEY